MFQYLQTKFQKFESHINVISHVFLKSVRKIFIASLSVSFSADGIELFFQNQHRWREIVQDAFFKV